MSASNPAFRRNNPKLPPVQGNVYRVKILGTVELQRTVNVFYYEDTRPPKTATHVQFDELAAALREIGGLILSFEACCTTDWQSDDMIIDAPEQPTLAPKTYLLGGDGTAPLPHLPTTVAVTIAKGTEFKGQCGRGHVSVPAVPAPWVTDSELTTLTAHLALATAMRTSIVAGVTTYEPVIYSLGSRTQPGAGTAGITSTIVRATLGSCRRRKLGVGV